MNLKSSHEGAAYRGGARKAQFFHSFKNRDTAGLSLAFLFTNCYD